MTAVARQMRPAVTAPPVGALATLAQLLTALSTADREHALEHAAAALATHAGIDAVAVRVMSCAAGARAIEAAAGRDGFRDGVLEGLVWPALGEPGATLVVPDLHAHEPAWSGSLAGAAAALEPGALVAVVTWSRQPHAMPPWHEGLVGIAVAMLAMAMRAGPPAAPGAAGDVDPQDLDPLTGLPDRTGFARRLAMLGAGPPGAARHYLLFVDVDRFRLVRASSDRLAATRLLRMLGRLLQHNIPAGAVLGRIGPDQFAVAIPCRSTQLALAKANALVGLVDALRLSFGGQRFEVSISIGVAEIDKRAPERLMRLAGEACLAAKRLGGGLVEVYRERRPGRQPQEGEGRLLNGMVAAIKQDRIALFAQAVAPTAAGPGIATPQMYELLLRLRDEDGELIDAGRLVALAERYGLSVRLDRWAIRAAFAAIARSRFARRDGMRFMLNLSGHSLDDARLLRFVIDEFTATGLSPSRICFEITETAAISDIGGAQRFVDGLRGLGCEFALDDFGSGHSSFLHLRDLAVDYVKIDGGLVSAIADDPVSLSLVRTIEGVGRLMGCRTIAEHVERPEILDAVRQVGCDYVQGYWIGAPLPLATVLAGGGPQA